MFYLERLFLERFRNYSRQVLRFHPRINILSGANAQGKTNLLEAIFFLAVNRSFRTGRDHELANLDSPCFALKGTFVKDDFNHTLQVTYQQNNRLKVLVNDERADRYGQLQHYPVVAFSPDDLQLIREGPAVRRRFINLEASRLNGLYLQELRDYQRVLNQRNHILKDRKYRSQINDRLAPWDQLLTGLGVNLIRARVELIKALEKEARHFFRTMTASGEELSLEYISTVPYCPDSAAMQDLFYYNLEKLRDQELRRFSTLLGPHLDDMRILINGRDSRRFSSQGQKRTAALALKMGEVSLFRQKNGLFPIVLLDDVFSELDRERSRQMIDFIKDSPGQFLITAATDLSDLVKELKREYKAIYIHKGSIVNETAGSDY